MPDTIGVVVRFGLYPDLMILFGVPLFSIYNGRTEIAAAERRRLRGLYLATAIIGLALSGLSMAVLAASMAGVSLREVDADTVSMLATGTAIGWAWQVRIAALIVAIVAALALSPERRFGSWSLSALGGVALASLAWTGHGAMNEGLTGDIHVVADIVHLLAAGAWVAAIFAFAVLLVRALRSRSWPAIERTHAALARFAIVGSIAVALLVTTGLVNMWLLVGWTGLASIGSSLYLQLLTVKLLLFLGMLGLAAMHRFSMTPALADALAGGDPSTAVVRIRRSVALEAILGIAILALVAWLGTLAPPASGG